MKISEQKQALVRTLSRKRQDAGGFTLVELLVVMGIIVIIVAAAVPAISALSGTRSIQGCQNTIAAMLGTARARAIGLQQNTGVMFFYDTVSRRQVMALVVPDPKPDNVTLINKNGLYEFDLVPNFELEPLPQGVGVQLIYSPTTGAASTDRYVSNPGLILFDSHGVLMYTPYAIRPGNPVTGTGSVLGQRMNIPSAFPSPANPQIPMTQVGVALFDAETFRAQGFDPGVGAATFTATDSVFGGPPYTAGSTSDESSEEKWLDANANVLLINRYNGTFMRSEPQ